MIDSKRLAAGTMLLAFNVSIGLSAAAPAFAGQQMPVPQLQLQLAQANPSDMTEEELRKQRRQQRRQNAAEEQPAAPQTTPQAPAVVEPRKNQNQLRREQRQEQRQEKRQQRQEPAQRAEPDVQKPERKAAPVEKPRKQEQRQQPVRQEQKKAPADPVDNSKTVTPATPDAPATPKSADRPRNNNRDAGNDSPQDTTNPPANNTTGNNRPARADRTPQNRPVTGQDSNPPASQETTAPAQQETTAPAQEVTTPREFRDPAARPQRERASREQLRERRNERREQVRSRPDKPRIQEPLAPVTAEPGERIRREDAVTQRRPDRDNIRDSRRFGDRTVLRLGDGRLVVERGLDENRRINRDARDVVVDRLPGLRQRETVTRSNGTKVVTIYNRYGDIIRRSRITVDGREIVLFVVPRDRWDSIPGWDRDPGYDLPPIVIGVPYDDYIWEPEQASADDYYDFLYQPPVETSERLYSVDEVRRSARLRQKLPRIDLSTVTFAFGSAEVREGDVEKLEALAEGMNRILKDNPGETFLIEGHTDAIGSEEANLALSDRRAEAVAVALTDVFGLPPENLVTQGYGESDLKVATEAAEERNRRVTVRRITALVTDSDAQVSAR